MRLMKLISLGNVLPSGVRRALRPKWNLLLQWERYQHERQFYRQFVRRNDLVFDIGCNIGEKTGALLSLGAKVVAVDPNLNCIESMRKTYRAAIAAKTLQVECGAVGATPGEISLTMIDSTSGMYSGAADFVRYATNIGYSGTETRKVACVTLDQLIEKYGKPEIIKVDVEGMDADVLKGLQHRPRVLSFEYHAAAEIWNKTVQCFEEAKRLGFVEANLTNGAETEFILSSWVPLNAVFSQIEQWRDDGNRWGDVVLR
jgi:FkbM family methyltransferase